MVRVGCQVRVFGGGQDGAMAEDFLYLEQIDTRFDQMSGIAVAQAVQGDLFLGSIRISQSKINKKSIICCC